MSDKVIQFPGAAGRQPPAEPAAKRSRRKTATGAETPPTGETMPDPATLSEDQRKALQVVLSGMPFVLVGIKPTGGGADFFTAVHGEAGDLRNAGPHLPGVIERAFSRKGV